MTIRRRTALCILCSETFEVVEGDRLLEELTALRCALHFVKQHPEVKMLGDNVMILERGDHA